MGNVTCGRGASGGSGSGEAMVSWSGGAKEARLGLVGRPVRRPAGPFGPAWGAGGLFLLLFFTFKFLTFLFTSFSLSFAFSFSTK